MIKIVLLGSLLAFLQGTANAAETFLVRKSSVSFKAIGKPGFLRINGEGAQIEGEATVDGSKLLGTFRCPLDQFSTGMALRDKHMKETYLETPKFPVAELSLAEYSLGNDSFKGSLNLHGVRRDISGQAKVTRDTSSLKIVADFSALLSDFGVNIPSYAGIKVADSVEIHVDAEAERKP